MAKVIFDDWIFSLPMNEHKMLVVMLMETAEALSRQVGGLDNRL